MRKYKFALLGYYGFGNLGDELLLEASLKILESSGTDLNRVVVLSNNPEETANKFHVEAFSRWKFSEVFKILSNSEFLMLGGGGLFQDSTSVMSCVWYWGVVRLAKLLGAVPVAFGQSLGVLNSKISKLLTRNAVKACKIFHVRDSHSFNTAKTFGAENIIQGVDLALTLNPENFVNKNKIQENILLNLRPYSGIEKFIDILSGNLKNNVIGVALSQDDVKILEFYKSRLNISEIILIRDLHSAKLLWEKASDCVGMRLHFGILSQIFGVKCVLMPYDVKVESFAAQSKIPCMIDTFVNPEMPAKISENYFDNICKIIKAL